MPLKESLNRPSRHPVWLIDQVDGEKMYLSKMAPKYGLKSATLRSPFKRYRWSLERALTEPLRGAR